MKIIARGILASVSLLIVVISIAATSFAQTPAKPLKDELVGHWQLVAVSVNNASPYGAAPQGSMFLDAAGNYSIVVVTGGRAKSISYFGTYTVGDTDSTVTLHIIAGSSANAAGRDQKRFITINGDEMTMQNQKTAGPIGDLKLTWKRT